MEDGRSDDGQEARQAGWGQASPRQGPPVHGLLVFEKPFKVGLHQGWSSQANVHISRKHCIALVEWKPFDFFILSTIIGNCVCLAVYTPFPGQDSNETNAILVGRRSLWRLQLILLHISGKSRIRFSVYFHCRVHHEDHSPGFYPAPECLPEECLEHSRLYNCDDRVGTPNTHHHLISCSLYRVVSTILSTMKIDQFDVKALRAFRVLRPLRLVSGVPSELSPTGLVLSSSNLYLQVSKSFSIV